MTGELYPVTIRYGYGEIWSRPRLEHRQRAVVAVVAFSALRLAGQAAKFGRSALNVGLTRTPVVEAIMPTAPLTGFPPALNALSAIGA
ncbi:carboxymuconolactone decarboxylase family protein [Rhodopila sp.]|uniref:carboxymuconolactone decarboxylase family protein n=1 Tax=Rhodopila sp. TaxID=2480087 RepID=UPI003D10CB02